MEASRPDRTYKTSNPERDTQLHSHNLAQEIHKERQREIERRLQFRFEHRSRIRRPSLRSRLGHGLIQMGSMLAADPAAPAPCLQPAARR
jgi:hypothetical protein